MTDTNKALTISYGNLTCILEGFDASSDTMSAVAEYLCAFASSDRCIHAEPQTLKAAEQELARRINAQGNEVRIVLHTTELGVSTVAETTTLQTGIAIDAETKSGASEAGSAETSAEPDIIDALRIIENVMNKDENEQSKTRAQAGFTEKGAEADLASDSDNEGVQSPPLRARVVKMKRQDLEAAITGGELEEIFETADDTKEPVETSVDFKEEALSDTIVVETKAPLVARAQETSAVDKDASRLFYKAQTQLDAPEAKQRRNALRHMRAAIAAAETEPSVHEDRSQASVGMSHHSSAATAAFPRRPKKAAEEKPDARQSRPCQGVAARPHPPLLLLAEQRVDIPMNPVRPRRVLAAKKAIVSQASNMAGFAGFVEDVGAITLSGRLEAAAAYISDIEGCEEFTRPMLMGKLKEVELENFSRPDSLQSLGKLLQEGKLQKFGNGRFRVTEQTDFRTQIET